MHHNSNAAEAYPSIVCTPQWLGYSKTYAVRAMLFLIITSENYQLLSPPRRARPRRRAVFRHTIRCGLFIGLCVTLRSRQACENKYTIYRCFHGWRLLRRSGSQCVCVRRVHDCNLPVFGQLLARDAMHKHDPCRRAVSVCPSVCLSVCHVRAFCPNEKSYIKLFSPSSSVPLYLSAPNLMTINIPTGTTQTEASNARVWKSRLPANISLYLENDRLYSVPYLRYSASNNGVTLKSGLGVAQKHSK